MDGAEGGGDKEREVGTPGRVNGGQPRGSQRRSRWGSLLCAPRLRQRHLFSTFQGGIATRWSVRPHCLRGVGGQGGLCQVTTRTLCLCSRGERYLGGTALSSVSLRCQCRSRHTANPSALLTTSTSSSTMQGHTAGRRDLDGASSERPSLDRPPPADPTGHAACPSRTPWCCYRVAGVIHHRRHASHELARLWPPKRLRFDRDAALAAGCADAESEPFAEIVDASRQAALRAVNWPVISLLSTPVASAPITSRGAPRCETPSSHWVPTSTDAGIGLCGFKSSVRRPRRDARLGVCIQLGRHGTIYGIRARPAGPSDLATRARVVFLRSRVWNAVDLASHPQSLASNGPSNLASHPYSTYSTCRRAAALFLCDGRMPMQGTRVADPRTIPHRGKLARAWSRIGRSARSVEQPSRARRPHGGGSTSNPRRSSWFHHAPQDTRPLASDNGESGPPAKARCRQKFDISSQDRRLRVL